MNMKHIFINWYDNLSLDNNNNVKSFYTIIKLNDDKINKKHLKKYLENYKKKK